MALAPNPTWWMEVNGTPQLTTNWHFDQIIAGNNPVLTETTFYIWNNKGETDPTKRTNRMTDCKITTLDGDYVGGDGVVYSAGGHSSPLVTERWVSLNCERTLGTDWVAMGGYFDGGGSWYQVFAPIGAVGARDLTLPRAGEQEIWGEPNDGTFIPEEQNTNDANRNNYAKFKMRISVPEHAIAGPVHFIVRCYYNIAAPIV